MSWLAGNYEITAEATRAYNEAKGATGEQPADFACDVCEDEGCAECLEESDRDRVDDR